MRNVDLSTLYREALEDLDDLASLLDCRDFNIVKVSNSLESYKEIRDDINEVFYVELDSRLEAPKEYLTQDEMLCLVYCYYRNDYLTNLIKLTYPASILQNLKRWSEILYEINKGIDKCLNTLSHGQYESQMHPTFRRLFGKDSNVEAGEFINQRVGMRLLKMGFLNKTLNLAGFSAWDKYSYMLRLKHDLVREEMLPYLRKKSVLGGYNYNDSRILGLLYFSNDLGYLVEDVTFVQAVNTKHCNSAPILRSYNSLLGDLNKQIDKLRGELNLPVVESFASISANASSFLGVSIIEEEISSLFASLHRSWLRRDDLKHEETLAEKLDRMC